MNKETREILAGGKKVARKVYTVFDATRDNKGKGVKAKDLVAVLQKIV